MKGRCKFCLNNFHLLFILTVFVLLQFYSSALSFNIILYTMIFCKLDELHEIPFRCMMIPKRHALFMWLTIEDKKTRYCFCLNSACNVGKYNSFEMNHNHSQPFTFTFMNAVLCLFALKGSKKELNFLKWNKSRLFIYSHLWLKVYTSS